MTMNNLKLPEMNKTHPHAHHINMNHAHHFLMVSHSHTILFYDFYTKMHDTLQKTSRHCSGGKHSDTTGPDRRQRVVAAILDVISFTTPLLSVWAD